jgi:large subunit ribosomal protein L25
MMEIIKLTATPRPLSGKGPSRRLRASAQIPAIAYGPNLAATPIAVSPKALLAVLTSPHGKNSVVELAVDGGDKLTVLVRDYSYHPLTRELQHADFLQIKLDEPIEVEVPFVCVGKAKGLITGGVLQIVYRRVRVRALPERIPVSVDVDITELDINDSLKANQIKLQEGVVVLLPPEQTVVVVSAPEKAGEEEAAKAAVPGAPGAAGAPAAGAPGAPGAAGAPAAAGAAAGAAGAKPGDKAAAAPAAKAAAKGDKKK